MARRPKPWFRKGRGWYVTISGTQYNLGPEKKAAYDEYHRLMRQPTERRQVSSQSLPAIADKFLTWVQENRALDTYIWYRDLLQKFVKIYSELRAQDVQPYHVQEWVSKYTHLSQNSRRNHYRAVSRCFKWATQWGYIQENPLQYLEMPSQVRSESIVTFEQYEELIKVASPESFRDLIIVTWETGCRPQESLRVEARHVDLANQRWVIPASEAKGKRMARTVYLTDEGLHITKWYMLKHPEGRLFRNTSGRPWSTEAVSCAFDRIRIRMGKSVMQQQGLAVTEQQIDDFIPTLDKKCKVKGKTHIKSDAELRAEAKQKLTNRLAASLAPRYSLYALRHSYATHALERIDSVTLAVLLGHSDRSTLARVYQHLDQNPKFLLSQAKKAVARA